MLSDEHLSQLRNVKGVQEWNDLASKIKAAHGGRYPSDWGDKVMLSGLMREVLFAQRDILSPNGEKQFEKE